MNTVEKEKAAVAFKNIEKRNSNYSPVKLYPKEKNKEQTIALEDKEINSFEKLDAFVEANLNTLTIDKEFTCKIIY